MTKTFIPEKTSTAPPEMKDAGQRGIEVYILIQDLAKTAIELNAAGRPCVVVASGSIYATIVTSDDDLKILSKADIGWKFDF